MGEVVIRPYVATDYPFCEALVSDAWGFDRNLRPQGLADLGKYIYTMGSVAGSNDRMVAEADGRVAGFLFGFNNTEPVPPNEMSGFGALWRILVRMWRIQGMTFAEKRRFLGVLNTHSRNRSKLTPYDVSEVVLFVVDPAHQGAGIGSRMLAGFLDRCRSSGVPSVQVETNHAGAAGFYQKAGFEHMGDFDSPLHALATPDGQACMLMYRM